MHPALADHLGRLRAGPRGPDIAAFFELDGTLIESTPVDDNNYGRRPSSGIARLRIRSRRSAGTSSEAAAPRKVEQTIRRWVGRTPADIQSQSEERFKGHLAGSLRYDSWSLLRAHQNLGHTVVLVTETTDLQALPWARALGIEHVLGTRVRTRGGVVTGEAADGVLWGAQKCAAIRTFADSRGLNLGLCHAYANGDMTFLETVGNPHPVNPIPELARQARAEQQHPVYVRQRRRGRSAIAAARTASMFACLIAAGAAGVAAGILRNDQRAGIDLATNIFGLTAPRLGRITIAITGAEHARAQRPAVFFVNHQSTLVDVVVTARVLARGFTIVVKKEVRDIPVVGRLFALAGVAFIDKTNTSQAISALQPAVQKLRSGISIAMSPEGTRSLTPAVGAFKKGGFHLARNAGVPIVPIVIRNAGELMWRNDKVAQSGTVDVVVHRPLPTAGWDSSDMERWRTEVHRLYTDTLDDWPGSAAGQRWSQLIDDAGTQRD
jgi:putative phosphoserine phosphatase / 1-acylglycerol-3-phosphate O-acyltransferase